MTRGGGGGWLLALLVATVAYAAPAAAADFRYGHVSWKRGAAGSREVRFTVTQAWGDGRVRSLPVDFGDGSVGIAPHTVIETGSDGAGTAYTVHRYEVAHTYEGDGPFVATIGSCCRPSDLMNAPGHVGRVVAVVDLRDAANLGSPASSAPAVLRLSRGGMQTFALAVTDPDGRGASCRLASGGEADIPAAPGGADRRLSVSAGCVLSWDTSAAVAGDRHAVQVVIESADVPAADETRVALDFLVEVVDEATPSGPAAEAPAEPPATVTAPEPAEEDPAADELWHWFESRWAQLFPGL